MSQKEIDHAIRTTFCNPPILASEDRAQSSSEVVAYPVHPIP
jgi:hypothetical protein